MKWSPNGSYSRFKEGMRKFTEASSSFLDEDAEGAHARLLELEELLPKIREAIDAECR
jgi:hypothetical protein